VNAWTRANDLVDTLVALHGDGALQLMTTSASHALLPALAPVEGAVRAQLAIGQAGFEALGGPRSSAVWLPECAISEAVDAALAQTGLTATVVDEHAVAFAYPRPPPATPIVSTRGVVYFPRDREATHRVWSPSSGFPGHPSYREFHHDLGLRDVEPPISGLKYWRVTSRGSNHKAPYRPADAQQRAQWDAQQLLEQLTRSDRALQVLAFDAELFGHWWFEGPTFLEHLMRGLHLSELELVTLDACAGRTYPLADPAPCSWGREGFFSPWLGPASASIWRTIHRTHRRVAGAVAAGHGKSSSLAAAVAELMLLEASDWPFMIDAGSFRELAQSRIDRQHQRVRHALEGSTTRTRFLAELDDHNLIEHFAG
jgi:1,4-alpha-glucan branching enzyme